MIVLSRAYWDRTLYKFIFHIYVPAVRVCMLPLLGTAIAAVACALCLLCALLTFGATLWSMNTVNMRPEHPWGQGAYGAGPRQYLFFYVPDWTC